ncbi:hypothetical protein ACFLRN_02510 [Thermoproteota archaeon]
MNHTGVIFSVFILAILPLPTGNLGLNAQIENTIISSSDPEVFYVGVTYCGDSVSDARLLIDRVKNFTNLLVVQSGPVSKNETMLNEICDYAVDSGLSIIVYFGKWDRDWQLSWLDGAKENWGPSLLGIYFFDEPAGSLLDSFVEMWDASSGEHKLEIPGSYDEMAEFFVYSWQTMPGLRTMKERDAPVVAFTSDYALYWFDYLAGYDVVFAQFGWNHSRIQDIALVRGAAKLQDKGWGVIVTWTFNNPPYLVGGDRLYEDLVMAYDNGAEYGVVFNYPKINDYGILNEGHFLALESFWNNIVQNSEAKQGSIKGEAVLVLPKNYGWGMRSLDDTIWGLWDADEKSEQIWNLRSTLIEEYSLNLDIVYDDPEFSVEGKYDQTFYVPTEKTEPFSSTWIVAAIVIVAVIGTSFLVYRIWSKKTTKQINHNKKYQ